MTAKGTLEVSESAGGDLAAESATMHLVVTGKKLFGATAALARSEEVRALVEALADAGVSSEDIKLGQIHAKNDGKGLLSGSSVEYRLRAKVKDLDQLPAALGAAVEASSCRLESIDWHYEAAPLRRELTRRALVAARERAEMMAAALDQRIESIKRIGEGPSASHAPRHRAMVMSASRGAAPELDLGTELVNSRWEEVSVHVCFRIVPEVKKTN